MSQHTTAVLEFISSRYPQAQLAATDDIFQVGYVNSLFAMELVMFVEKTFGVAIPNTELRIDNFRTAESIGNLVDRLDPALAGVS